MPIWLVVGQAAVSLFAAASGAPFGDCDLADETRRQLRFDRAEVLVAVVAGEVEREVRARTAVAVAVLRRLTRFERRRDRGAAGDRLAERVRFQGFLRRFRAGRFEHRHAFRVAAQQRIGDRREHTAFEVDLEVFERLFRRAAERRRHLPRREVRFDVRDQAHGDTVLFVVRDHVHRERRAGDRARLGAAEVGGAGQVFVERRHFQRDAADLRRGRTCDTEVFGEFFGAGDFVRLARLAGRQAVCRRRVQRHPGRQDEFGFPDLGDVGLVGSCAIEASAVNSFGWSVVVDPGVSPKLIGNSRPLQPVSPIGVVNGFAVRSLRAFSGETRKGRAFERQVRGQVARAARRVRDERAVAASGRRTSGANEAAAATRPIRFRSSRGSRLRRYRAPSLPHSTLPLISEWEYHWCSIRNSSVAFLPGSVPGSGSFLKCSFSSGSVRNCRQFDRDAVERGEVRTAGAHGFGFARNEVVDETFDRNVTGSASSDFPGVDRRLLFADFAFVACWRRVLEQAGRCRAAKLQDCRLRSLLASNVRTANGLVARPGATSVRMCSVPAVGIFSG